MEWIVIGLGVWAAILFAGWALVAGGTRKRWPQPTEHRCIVCRCEVLA
jgi:hypothetical protein